MSEKIIVPILGESITEATVSRWLKNIGDQIETDEALVELETDKVNVEVPSPVAGILSEIKIKKGKTVKVGSELGVVEPNGKRNKVNKNTSIKLIKEENSSDVADLENDKEEETTEQTPKVFDEEQSINKEEVLVLDNKEVEEPLILSQEITKDVKIEKNILSPAVRKIVDEKRIDIKNIKGSGKDGRILKGDLISLMGSTPKTSERKIKYGPEERIKMTRLRLTIAKRLKEAQQNAAILTTFNEVNMHDIMQIRKDYQDDFQKRFSIKLGFMSFFVKACVVALKNFPAINAEISGEEIVYKNYYNISFAVGTDRGLVVPVLKNADEMSFSDIEKNIKLISEKAKDGKLTIEDLQGGTFTISNGGVYGSMLSTPILNLPQSGVLGMHNIVERPIVEKGEIVSRPMMYLALSYDHRIVDGKESVSFLKCIKEHLEEPRRLFLNL
jgi:2-oxoglutarate dehydrogenase E2 component (dihydrolipoamide succinyltransferase)